MKDVYHLPEKWLSTSIAPEGVDLEVGVAGKNGEVVTLIFPVQRKTASWVDAVTKNPVDISPTLWRNWSNDRNS